MVGGDWSNTRYSMLAQINTRNVKRLGGAWVFKFDGGAISRVTPIVRSGLMFVTAGRQVYALNAKTGEKIWTYKTVPDTRTGDFATKSETPNSLNSAPNLRGVAVGQGLVFVGLQDGHVIALKEKTGELVWTRQTGLDQPKKGQSASAAPTYINGVVFTGLSNGDWQLRGRFTALDSASGKILWQMFAIPGPGEPGYETWSSFNDVWKFGGGGVWTNAGVDPELGIAYFTTGNPAPAFAGDVRPGDNLYTNSVLAVDIKTGKLKWYYQLVRHDVFDADAGTPVILYNAQVNGKNRKALAAMRADGYLFQLDRETGKPLLPIKERPVPQLASQRTSPTQSFPVAGESMLMSCEDWKRERIPEGFVLGCMWTPPAAPLPSKDPQNVLAPFPGVRVTPMAYSHQTGYFYAHGTSILTWPRRAHDPHFLDWVGNVPGLKAYGELAAIDGRTGKIVWKKRIPALRPGGAPLFYLSGGAIATAGGLMFRAGAGNIEAYDARTGDVLWQFQVGATNMSGSLATYEIDREQYIAVSAGSALWAFKLGGRIPASAVSTASTEDEEFFGPMVDTDEIQTTSLHQSLVQPGVRYFIDEYTFNPYRARVRMGTKVLFVNNGNMRHEFVALDGTWGTGSLSPTEQAWISFDKPGKYAYRCKDHPWSYGQIIVGADTPSPNQGMGIAEQARQGKVQFDRNCSSCHGEDLNGRATAPALLGNTFMSRWKNATVGDLFDRISATMPQASPGSLDRKTYLNIVAYLLQANNMTSGGNELKDNPNALKDLKFEQIALARFRHDMLDQPEGK